MPITGVGWELYLKRTAIQVSEFGTRTVGLYRVFKDGQLLPHFEGQICECIGPGSNEKDSDKRIKMARYPLWTHFLKYRTIGYSHDEHQPSPCIGLADVGTRTDILIHPGHRPNLYLSSVGCLNPTRTLAPAEMMDFWESLTRVVELIDSLGAFAPAAFSAQVNTRIDNARIVIEGEP
jgi:hypothetical protein